MEGLLDHSIAVGRGCNKIASITYSTYTITTTGKEFLDKDDDILKVPNYETTEPHVIFADIQLGKGN